MRVEPIDPELFTANRARLKELLKPRSIVIIHSNDIYPTNADGTMAFRQQNDLFYFTGIDQEETVLILMPDALECRDREILFVRETNEEIAIWEGEKLTKEEAARQTGISHVEWTGNFQAILHRLVPQADHIYLTTNEHLRAVVEVETRNARFIKECQLRYPLHRYERLAPLMHRLRMLKQPQEISIISKACAITERGFRRSLEFIRPGVGEWEIEAEFMHEFLRRGSKGFAYTPIIASGKSACILHYTKNDQICRDGDLILMDVAAEYAGWNSDMTRTVPVNGRFTVRQRAVYDAVLRVLRAANHLLRPGVNPSDYQKQILSIMEAELIHLGLIDMAEAREQGPDKPLVKRYFMHGTSHHLGLDVHDVAPAGEPFAEGMVLTIEPGIYIREEGLGIRLENNVVIGKDSNADLMGSIPIEAEEIEELMTKGR
jgi:Xaa-Pro aminopeptidase